MMTMVPTFEEDSTLSIVRFTSKLAWADAGLEIPSLSGPTTIATRQNGSGISWLFPFVANDPNMKSSQALTKVLPLMIGYFALSVPSGLSLYWLTNNILSTAQQVWLQKLGGAKNPVRQVQDDIIKDDLKQIQKSVSKLNSTKLEEAREGEKSTSEGPRPGERFRQLKEQEARKRQQREEEKRKAEEAAAKIYETHEKTVEGGNQVAGDLVVEKSKAVAADTDPSTSGVVVNGNPLSKDLEEIQNSVSTPQTENNEDSAHLNVVGINEKSQDKEPREVLTITATTNKQPPGEDSDHVTKD